MKVIPEHVQIILYSCNNTIAFARGRVSVAYHFHTIPVIVQLLKDDAPGMQDRHDLLTFLNNFVIKNEIMSQLSGSSIPCLCNNIPHYTLKGTSNATLILCLLF